MTPDQGGPTWRQNHLAQQRKGPHRDQKTARHAGKYQRARISTRLRHHEPSPRYQEKQQTVTAAWAG